MIATGTLAWIDGEHVVIDLVEDGDTSDPGDYWEPTETEQTGYTVFTLTVKRGALDTVPALHEVSAPIVFYGASGTFEDDIQTDGDVANVRLQTNDTFGVLDFDITPTDVVTFDSRANRPYAPGRFKLNGSYEQSTIVADTTLTWVDRDRLADSTTAPISHDDAGVTSEASVTYLVRADAFDEDGVLLDTFIEEDVGTDLTYNWDGITPALPVGTSYIDFSVASVRGGYESWQKPSIRAIVFVPPGDLAFEVL